MKRFLIGAAASAVIFASSALPAFAVGGSGGTEQPCRAPQSTESDWDVSAGGEGTGSGGSGGLTINSCTGGTLTAGGGS